MLDSSDTAKIAIPTITWFHTVADEMVGSANALMNSQTPSAVFRNRAGGAHIEITATAVTSTPMIQAFVNWA